MSNPEIVLIAAHDEQRGIGVGGKIPWMGMIPEDMTHFKDATVGHPVIMGRVTWDSISVKYRPLTDRLNIVVTRSADFDATGIHIAHSIEEAISIASFFDTERVSVMGGAQIYEQTLPLANKLNLTIVRGNFNCDAFFPDYTGFGEVVSGEWLTSSKGPKYRFLTINRTQP